MKRHSTIFDVTVLCLLVYLVAGCARMAWGQCYTLPNGQRVCSNSRPCPQVSPANTAEMSAPGPWAQGFSGIQITGPAGNTAVAGVVPGQQGQQPTRWVTSESKPNQEGKPVSISHPAVCYVEALIPAGSNEPWQKRSDGSYIRKSADAYAGSGVLVTKAADVAGIITVYHLFREAKGFASIRCTFYAGGYDEYPATLVRYDEALDIALLTIRPTARLPETIPVCDRNALPGEPVTMGGFGLGKFRLTSGGVIGYNETPYMTIQGSILSGDSGGPVLNSQGRLAGILWGTFNGTTYAVPCETWLKLFWPEWYASQNSLQPQNGHAMPGAQVPSLPERPAGEGISTSPATTPPAIPSTSAGTGSPPLPAIDPNRTGHYTEAELQRIEAGLVAVTDEVEALGRRLDEHLATPTPAPSIDAITAAVIKRLPPIQIQTLRQDGTVYQDSHVRLGDLLKLKAVPTPEAKQSGRGKP